MHVLEAHRHESALVYGQVGEDHRGGVHPAGEWFQNLLEAFFVVLFVLR